MHPGFQKEGLWNRFFFFFFVVVENRVVEANFL